MFVTNLLGQKAKIGERSKDYFKRNDFDLELIGQIVLIRIIPDAYSKNNDIYVSVLFPNNFLHEFYIKDLEIIYSSWT